MNPIANLPATQNLNKAQQSQGYNRQYFGGDEVDEVVLSNQEEQKKKKAWTIGGAILGAMALIGGCVFGANYFGYMGKDAKHLKGFKTLTTKNGDTTQELASIAKTTKAWTGASWGGVAETIKTTLDGKNDTKFKKIVLVASEDSQKALKESLGEDLFKKLTVIQANSDKIEDAVKNAVKYGKDKDNLIITDSSIDNLYDEIEKAIAPSDNSEKTEDAKEEKKAEKEQNPTEAPKTTETEKKEEEKKTEKNEEPPKPEVKQQPNVNVDGKFYGFELNSDENAQKIFNSLQQNMEKASQDIKKHNITKNIDINNLEKKINIFENQHKQYLEFKKTKEALTTYYKKRNEELQNNNNSITKQITEEYTNEKEQEKLNSFEDIAEKTKAYNEFNTNKSKLQAQLKQNNALLKKIGNSTKQLEKECEFEKQFDSNYTTMENVILNNKDYNDKNIIIAPHLNKVKNLQKDIEEQNHIIQKASDLLKKNLGNKEKEREIEKIKNAKNQIAKIQTQLTNKQNLINKTQANLRRLYKILEDTNKAEEQKKQQAAEQKAQEIIKTNRESFENSIQ